MKKPFFKYLIEFIVVFLGVTISFSLQEFSKDKENMEKRKGRIRKSF